MNSQHGQVRSWLESVFGSGSVPSYEVSEENLAALANLAELCQQRNVDAHAQQGLAEKQAREYRAEAERLANRVVKCTGINPTAGCSSLKPCEKFAEVLSEVSDLLDLDDPSPLEMRLRLSEVQTESAAIPARDWVREEERKGNKVARLNALKELSQNQLALRAAEAGAIKLKETSKQSSKNIEFIHGKQKEYLRNAEKAESGLAKNGFKKDLTHDAVTSLKGELNALSDTLRPLQAKLEGYEQLPPNMELARAKVAEAQAQLEDLKLELTSEISVLHV